MKPKRIFLVRHAQSAGNADRLIHATVPDWKIPLTDLGKEQAKVAGSIISDEIRDHNKEYQLGVYLSPYIRTKETWEHMKLNDIELAKHVKFEKQDPRLREQEWGNLRSFENRSWEDVEKERDEYGSFFYRFPHGESGADVWDRMSDFLSTLHRDFEKLNFPNNVLIVTHGYALRILLMRWFHLGVEDFHTIANPKNCQMYELQLNQENRYDLITPLRRYSGPRKFSEKD
jgi:broad specificity phosphatase PhoE